MSIPSLASIRTYIENFAFEDLFNDLGWDSPRDTPLPVILSGAGNIVIGQNEEVLLSAIAQKRGVIVVHINVLYERVQRRKIERELSKHYRENLIIYTDVENTQQVWHWTRREFGKTPKSREVSYSRTQSSEKLAQTLRKLAITLEEEERLSLIDVTSRLRSTFDIEPVTQQFYRNFKAIHSKLLEFITGIPDDNLERWYASIILNRLMFIYFIQQKAFLDNDQSYLKNKLEQAKAVNKNYYREFLTSLFFDGFATEARHRSTDVQRLLGDIPYLNGGLFLRHQIEEVYGENIQIPNEAFEEIFEFFDEWSWHLDDRALQQQNEINPEVLGYIFEKYINQKQMGAYYTKEDITEYISRNTIIPYLFDETSRKVPQYFVGESSVWQHLCYSPDDYIYDAVSKGITWTYDYHNNNERIFLKESIPLPENIEIGLEDVSQRTYWNTETSPEAGLPKEIWRETIARRQRYNEVRHRLESGEIQSINDFITHNLDIERFAREVILNADPELLLSFWETIKNITILDPTCGSGAFLFAALNILQPLYEACLDRMGVLLGRAEHKHDQLSQIDEFEKVLHHVHKHASEPYFILKNIIVNNLYGVDVMDEAVEIAKLRLFLKLIAQVEDRRHIEPLPDIDFNIRPGNTLVGFASLADIRNALSQEYTNNPTGIAQFRLLSSEEENTLLDIELRAGELARVFKRFKEIQVNDYNDETISLSLLEIKKQLTSQLKSLTVQLNKLLGKQYLINVEDESEYYQWLRSHTPFHWCIEFYEVLSRGGFDTIIGNPPYVEYSSVKEMYKVLKYRTESCANLYAYTLERCLKITKSYLSRVGMIVPVASVCTSRYEALQKLLKDTGNLYISNFNDRPGKLFEGLEHIRLSIILWEKVEANSRNIYTTKYNRWYSEARNHLFELLEFTEITPYVRNDSIPKLTSHLELKILSKLNSQSRTLGEYIHQNGEHKVFYTRKLSGFVQILNFIPGIYQENGSKREPSELKMLPFESENFRDIALGILNSNLFYWYLTLYSDCRNLNKREVTTIPISLRSVPDELAKNITYQVQQLMNDLEHNSKYLEMRYKKWGLLKIQCIYPKYSKGIIDQIDNLFKQYYQFTDEELDFIVNYDIKYRVGDELNIFDDENE